MRHIQQDRVTIPGVGPSAAPFVHLRGEEIPRGAEEPFPSRAARALADDLRRRFHGEVRFDRGSRAMYATDGSNYRQVPIGVVVPRSTDEVPEILAACRRHGAPVLARGGGTSLAGQCCNVAVVIDFSKYCHRILSLDPAARTAWVEPGLVLDDLREAAEAHHLTFAPDPATHSRCTLGGMIGNDSCGVHSIMGGRTVDNVLDLDVLLYDGTRMRVGATSDAALDAIVRAGGRRGEVHARLRALADRYGDLVRQRFPNIPRRVSGYELDQLLPEAGFQVARSLVGSEGTCVVVLGAKVRLIPSPPQRVLVLLGYPDVYAAAEDAPEVLSFGAIGLEGVDDRLVEDMKKKKLHPERLELLPPGKSFLLVEFGGETREEARAKASRLVEALRGRHGAPSTELVDDPHQQHEVWKLRESALGATARVPGQKDAWEGWEDSAVPPEKLATYLRGLHALFDRYGYRGPLYGHFGHACVHTRIDFDLTSAEGIAKYRRFVTDAAHLVVSLGGSLSGEHGDGQSRGELLPIMYGEELVEAFREMKRIWDPDWKMNPGKVVDPYRLDENLRLGPGFQESRPRTYFRYEDDDGSFGRAALRCVGVGECRREKGGVMCPSYMVTREEKHSTRGRARLLFEMMEGDPLEGGWRDEHVKEALDLCLACKGCKTDCPMNVDMARYKAEFLAHYYEGRLRPRSAYAMGLIDRWARAAALAPQLANAASHAPGLASVAKWAAGIAPEREVPRFAPWTFRSWFRATHPSSDARGEPILLFVDTFNDHFHPETAAAALRVLERAGYAVRIPRRRVCCGRPLYDFGMLPRARRYLEDLLDALAPDLEAGAQVVGIEPSCAAVLRDELLELMPDDPRARQLARSTVLLSELIERDPKRFDLPRLEGRRAVVQGHCHHHAVVGLDAELATLRRLGLDVERPDSGCCGMAGSFGFERGDHYDVSIACGERGILPAVRRAPRDALIVANGFSCREQIAQGTDRRGLHLAEVIELARREAAAGEAYPERDVVGRWPKLPWRARIARGAVKVAIAAAAVWVARRALARV
jgi:FAD/FMN-containing dehydrogenase/Fe-S oxidoreductase